MRGVLSIIYMRCIGETEGHIWDEVRMQSWGGKGRVGVEFWTVDESKQSVEKKAEDESTGYYLDELDEFDDEGWREGRG
jgi:hypothetical protein